MNSTPAQVRRLVPTLRVVLLIGCAVLSIALIVWGIYLMTHVSTWRVSYEIQPTEFHEAGFPLALDNPHFWWIALVLAVLAGMTLFLFRDAVSGLLHELVNVLVAPMLNLASPALNTETSANGGVLEYAPILPVIALVILLLFFLFGGPAAKRFAKTLNPWTTPTPLPTQPQNPPPPNTMAVQLIPEGPSLIKASEQVPIGITVSFDTQVSDNPVFLDSNQEYLVATRLQPGAFDVSSEYLKERLEILRAGNPIKLQWIIAPKLDRIGTQRVLFDTDFYDKDRQRKYASRSLIATFNVENPSGLPSWVVFLFTIGSGVVLTFISTDMANRLKERRAKKRKEKEARTAAATGSDETDVVD